MTPILETARLVFRPYEPADRERLVALFTDPEVMRYVGTGVRTEEEARGSFTRLFTHVYGPEAFDVWALVSKEDGEFVGHAELKPRRDELARDGDFEIIYVLGERVGGAGSPPRSGAESSNTASGSCDSRASTPPLTLRTRPPSAYS